MTTTTTTSGALLRERMARVGRAKDEQRGRDTEAHLRMSPGDRIAATLRLSQSTLALFPRREPWVDDALEVWTRVNLRLSAARRG
ncbi:MAG: hypothetical protein Q8O67_11845 [Deltaproteobacteria bacterium]|nr:hypothetical protein [Deltaproteobacteria bacterium]